MQALKAFLHNHRCQTDKSVHKLVNLVDLANYSRYHIPDLEYDTFLRLYAEALKEGSQLSLIELREKHFNMFADIDIREADLNLCFPNGLPPGFLNNIITAFNVTIEVICGSRDVPVITCRTSSESSNYGFHLHWPNLIVDTHKAKVILEEVTTYLTARNNPSTQVYCWNKWIDNTTHSNRLLGSLKPGNLSGETKYLVIEGFTDDNLPLMALWQADNEIWVPLASSKALTKALTKGIKEIPTYEDIKLTSIKVRQDQP